MYMHLRICRWLRNHRAAHLYLGNLADIPYAIIRLIGRYIKDWGVKSNMAGSPSSAKFAGCNQQFSGAIALSKLKAAGLVTIHFDARQSA